MAYPEERADGIEKLLFKIEAHIQQRADTDRPLPRMRWVPYYYKRRNDHFSRDKAFYSDVIRVLHFIGEALGDNRVVQTSEATAGLLHEATLAEPLKKVWVPRLSGGLGNLAREFHKHSQRQMALNDMIAVMLGLALGSPISISGEPVPLRSSWIYSWRPGLAIADINRHLAQQAATEDEIMSHLGILCNQMTMR